MPSQNFALMFQALDGGVVKPVKWSKEHLKPDQIVIVIDEENQVIWMWSGKANGIVKRRTALRQAESLKGHGHTIGKAIIGRGIREIIEIDDRKVGRVEEDTKNYEKFTKLLEQSIKEVGDNVVVFGEGGAPAPAPAPKPEPKPEPKVEKPKLETPKVEVKSAAVAPKPKLETPKIQAKAPAAPVEAKPKLEAPVVKAAGTVASSAPAPLKTELLKGVAILAVLSEFPDIYVSKKPSGAISLESLDGDICNFKIEGDVVKFTDTSFQKISADKKESVMGALEMLEGSLK